MSKYLATIGLEVHAELSTETKMFCRSKNDPDEKRPNVNVCPVCVGHPGTLPVINKKAVEYVLKFGLAVHGELADFTEFDRKNYFYPDIPKGYQISQYKYPLVKGGELSGVRLTRVHLEEDTGTSIHDRGDYGLVDYNRAGVPLMELVTEPVITSAVEAGVFARELQLLLRYLKISEANMEKGEMRVEANISVRPEGQSEFGTKVEVKNLNSFRSVERSIEFEIERQIELLESGKEVVQETRGFDENKQVTFSQRKKESAHDYRYFPDPDLPKLKISEIPEFSEDVLRKSIPELPVEKRERYKKDFGLDGSKIEMFISNQNFADLLELSAKHLDGNEIKIAVNYITSDVAGLAKDGTNTNPSGFAFSPKQFATLISMYSSNKISSRGVKDILAVMYKDGGEPEKIAEDKGLIQQNDEGAIIAVVSEVLKENESVVNEYKEGKESSLKFLIGQGMKKSKGSANPSLLQELLIKEISKR
ncbi:MAG: Asp-tRNA(Asn)/Glu-tRNA(Gln) amidotransferase GatCAB subunit B [Parcubacteria group bacterium CG11_big_fil_rev_8_21_14_0_20_39_22]|nr:MAG: Asp-tRNA(Asn)/Glu-tRNA(Gln) amidotransferase GatCAB subunit B [Parcubacteria group bacterium CG11_big_fil_rev_8_21_14_0_20_39_22]